MLIHDFSLNGSKCCLSLIIIILLILFGGGGGYYAHRSYGGRGLGGVLGLVLVILLILWLLGALTTGVVSAPAQVDDAPSDVRTSSSTEPTDVTAGLRLSATSTTATPSSPDPTKTRLAARCLTEVPVTPLL